MQPAWVDRFQEWLRTAEPAPFLQIAVVGLLALPVAALLEVAVGAVLRRLLPRFLTVGADRLTTLARTTTFRTVVLVGLLAGSAAAATRTTLASWMEAALRTVLVLVWISAAVRGGTVFLAGLSQSPAGPRWIVPTTVPLVNNAWRVALLLVATYMILITWHVNVTGLVASAGILGIALSFAAQDTLGNLFAGAAILIDSPYRIGDYIVLDSGERGQVTHVGLRSTRILSRDDEEISIPNGVIGRAKIINESGGPSARYRLRVRIGVAYGSDIDQVTRVLLEVAGEHTSVSRQPEPRVRLRAFEDSAIAFELLAWIVNPALRGLVLHELNCQVYKAFMREGITIPFPQRDVHVRDYRRGLSEP